MRFDFFSFVLGFLFATLIYGLIFWFRKPLGVQRDRFVTWYKKLLETLNSGEDKRYREDVAVLWQKNHLAGSVVGFDEVYVPPRFWLDLPPMEPNKEEELDITSVIPATADYPELASFYKSPSYALRDLTRHERDLVILGKPGMGKSMLLVEIGLRAARLDEAHFATPTLPVLVHAGDLELPINEKTDVAEPLLIAAAERLSALTGPTFPSFYKNVLKGGRGIILLDGIDDLPLPQQTIVLEWVEKFKTAYPNNQIVATGPLTGFSHFIERGFTPVILGGWANEDYMELVNKWVVAWNNMLAKQKRKRAAEDDPDPALVAGWLTGGAIGRTPLDVTAKIWTGLAGDAEGPRLTDWLETFIRRLSIAPEARKALERAAVEMLNRERYGLERTRLRELLNTARAEIPDPSNMDTEDLLDELASKGGLLVLRAGGRYSLSHSVLAGYLAAKVFITESNAETLIAAQQNPLYATALRFYAALGNPVSLITQRLAATPDALQSDLFFIANWLGDAPNSATWKADIFRKLAQVFITPNNPMDLRMRAVCALVMSRDENVLKLFKQSLANPDAFTRQCAASALGALSDITAVPELAKLLNDQDLYVTWSAALALALIGDEASMEALGKGLLEGNEMLKQAVCDALALHPSEGHKMLQDAITINDIIARRSAIGGLKRIGPKEWVLQLLDKALAEDTQWIVRSAAESALKDLRTPVDKSPQALPPVDQTPWLITYAASRGQGVPSGPEARQSLIQALQEGDDGVRAAAADHLGRIAAAEALPALTEAARDKSLPVKEMAYRALAKISLATGERVTL